MSCFVVPISPKCAVCLVPKEYPATKDERLWLIEESNDICRMNKQALCMELAFNCEFIVAADITELQELKEYAEENKERLEVIRKTVLTM